MAHLAIRGHSTRGSEVINILEMLGGINKWEYLGDRQLCVYYINCDGIINYTSNIKGYNLKIFTLDEFIEKYPYKVGDKVGVVNKILEYEIWKMEWNGECIIYYLSYENNYGNIPFNSKELRPYKEHDVSIGNYYCIAENNRAIIDNNNNDIQSIPKIIFDNCESDEVELDLGDNFEIKYKDEKPYVARKKPKYPKTYEECCDILNINKNDSVTHGYKNRLLDCFHKLIICRDAYRKIANWEPNWNDDNQEKWGISFYQGGIYYTNSMLNFSSKEIRDTFRENFKELIEECKELL